ncbi:MAG: DUF4062 domain-containing protein [Chloroflexota bacterium]|nr:DUF4062 domain-containing protein [Chloroflexota bacterium]
MDRNLDVFVSSATSEFAAERVALKAALARWQFVRAWVFENETAHPRPVVEDFLTRVAECDVYVLLLGKQLTPPVEAEYRTAVATKRPILAFIKDIPDRDISAAGLIKEFEATLAFKYARFDATQDLEAKVVEAVGSTLLWRSRLTPQQSRSIIKTIPPLSSEDRIAAGKTYLAEVIQRYQIWSTRYTLLAATARLRPERPSQLPAEFLPRGFGVLLREKFPPQAREQEDKVKTEHFEDLREAIEKHGDLVLLGDPGAGKTTTLWRLMYDHAQRADSRASEARIPVLVRMGRYDGKQAVVEFVRDELIESSKETEEHPSYPAHGRIAAHLQEYLEDGRLLILFDALNEMPLACYVDSVRRLETFRERHRSTRFVFTCRALDYTVKLDLPEATIQELDEQRIQTFLSKHWGWASSRQKPRFRTSSHCYRINTRTRADAQRQRWANSNLN